MIQCFSAVIAFVFVLPATLVLACEGECIVGITNALLGNYTTPIENVWSEMVSIYLLNVSPH